MGTPVQQEFLTLNEAAVLFGVCTNTIRRRIAAGDLRAVRLGRATRIPRCEVERLVQATRSSVDGLTELQAEAARTNERSGVIAYLAGVLDRIIGYPRPFPISDAWRARLGRSHKPLRGSLLAGRAAPTTTPPTGRRPVAETS
jgi:excisionase family DNA binding protein